MTYTRCDKCQRSDEKCGTPKPPKILMLAVQASEWICPVYIHLCLECLSRVLPLATYGDGKRAAKLGDIAMITPEKPRKRWLWQRCNEKGEVAW